jgi:hypothetical protein
MRQPLISFIINDDIAFPPCQQLFFLLVFRLSPWHDGKSAHRKQGKRERETSTMCDMTLILSEPSQIESGWELAPIHSEALKQ